jgi:REP element-mobilizing transposase RayT
VTPVERATDLRGAGSQPATRAKPRGAGFQPATGPELRLRRPKHYDLGQIPYFVTTRTHEFERIFVGLGAQTAMDELLDLRRKYGFLVPAFVFMADHAHVLIVPAKGFTISQTMRLVKGGIARRVNSVLKREGAVWQDGFRDNAPRSIDELHAYITYIEQNPVRAGLTVNVGEYPFSSAAGRCESDYQAFFALEREDAG